MDMLINILQVICIIPLALFAYGQFSSFYQYFFTKDYDDYVHGEKWQLYSTPCYILLILGYISIANFFFQSILIANFCTYAIIVVALWYGVRLLIHHVPKFLAKIG